MAAPSTSHPDSTEDERSCSGSDSHSRNRHACGHTATGDNVPEGARIDCPSSGLLHSGNYPGSTLYCEKVYGQLPGSASVSTVKTSGAGSPGAAEASTEVAASLIGSIFPGRVFFVTSFHLRRWYPQGSVRECGVVRCEDGKINTVGAKRLHCPDVCSSRVSKFTTVLSRAS